MNKNDIEIGIIQKTQENGLPANEMPHLFGYIYLRGQAIAEITGKINSSSAGDFVNLFISGDERPKNEAGYPEPNFKGKIFETGTGSKGCNLTFNEFDLSFPMLGWVSVRNIDGMEFKAIRFEATDLELTGDSKDESKEMTRAKHLEYNDELIEENNLDYDEEDFKAMAIAFEGANEFYEKYIQSQKNIAAIKQKEGKFFKPKPKTNNKKTASEVPF